MSNTVFNNHPLIKNSNQYFLEKKFISIHSDDRDILKYPNSAQFEITLPQEYLNIASARLYSWSFPSNYNVFSITNTNVFLTFKFVKLYNPGEHMVSDVLLEGIFAALYYYNNDIILEIEPGFYNPDQMATELTNKMNEAITIIIKSFFNGPNGSSYAAAAALFKQYNRFKVVYNSVTQKLWFGNNADKFILTNEASILSQKVINENQCLRRNELPEFSNWGLPFYLGFTKCNSEAFSGEEFIKLFPIDSEISVASTVTSEISVSSTATSEIVPRFYYGDAIPGTGDNGYWLLPNLPGATVYFLQAPLKIAFMGPAYIYMEIEGMNCIDETIPYALNSYTTTNSNNNGIVNSAFAKIPVPTTPISQWFDDSMGPYKYWNPPAERLSKLKIKFRYHNGVLVQFGNFEYSFMLEFNILKPQQERSYSIVNSFDLSQHQSFASKFI